MVNDNVIFKVELDFSGNPKQRRYFYFPFNKIASFAYYKSGVAIIKTVDGREFEIDTPETAKRMNDDWLKMISRFEVSGTDLE